MLSKAYFLAKFRFDTVENEPAENLQKKLILLIPPHWPIPSGIAALQVRAGVGVGLHGAELPPLFADALRDARHALAACALRSPKLMGRGGREGQN